MNKKTKLRFLSAICAVLMLFMCIQTTAFPVFAEETTSTIKIMPLGDSITDCDFWRTKLYNKLIENDYDVDFVGSQYAYGYSGHEGHSGMLVTDLAQGTQLSTWLSSANPDMVMMCFGTNDCWCDKGTTAILNAYTTLVGQMRENNPNMIIVVAQITPLIPNFENDYTSRVADLDAAMVDWAADLTTEESPITLCDQFTGYDVANDTYDGVHPNDNGSAKFVTNWYATLSPILDALQGTTTTVEPSATAEATVEPTSSINTDVEVTQTPSPSPSEEVTVEPTEEVVPSEEVTVEPTEEVTTTPTVEVSANPNASLALTTQASTWSTGYTMNVTVSNTSDTTISDWKLVVNASDFTISNMWCAEYAVSGDYIIITPLSWNASIPAGGSVNFGFQGTGLVSSDFAYTLE